MKQKILHSICFCAVLIMAACSASTADLEKGVKDLANEKMAGTGVKATKVSLVHKSGNDYTGLITLTDGEETEEYDINVTYDGRTFQYEIPALLDE